MRIGIYGGSFNPIHNGHVALAKKIGRKARLDEVWFMVSPLNPFKADNTDLLPDEVRLELVRTVLRGEQGLKACDYEFRMPRPSYTWNTLQSLSSDYPEHDFVLIIGADNWTAFPRWYHADDILARYPVIVYPRDGHTVDPDAVPAGVTVLNTTLYKYSSSEIRQRIRAGRSVRRMVHPDILCDVVSLYSAGNASEKTKNENKR